MRWLICSHNEVESRRYGGIYLVTDLDLVSVKRIGICNLGMGFEIFVQVGVNESRVNEIRVNLNLNKINRISFQQ